MELTLYHFSRDEFRGWFDRCDPRLLILLDSLRHQWGQPIRISPADGAIGREMRDSISQHNIDKWGSVRAVDVYPEGVTNEHQAREFIDLAEQVGFTGIGVYPDWAGGIGFHLDVRVDAQPGKPAKWGAVNNENGVQRYVALSQALEMVA